MITAGQSFVLKIFLHVQASLYFLHLIFILTISKGSDHAHFHLTPQPLYIVGLAIEPAISYSCSTYNVARQHTSCLPQSTSQHCMITYSTV